MTSSSTIKIDDSNTQDSIIIKAAHVVPTANQYAALKNEFIAFRQYAVRYFLKEIMYEVLL